MRRAPTQHARRPNEEEVRTRRLRAEWPPEGARRGRPSRAQERGLGGTTPASTWFPASSLQTCETAHACCLNHSVCGSCYGNLDKLRADRVGHEPPPPNVPVASAASEGMIARPLLPSSAIHHQLREALCPTGGQLWLEGSASLAERAPWCRMPPPQASLQDRSGLPVVCLRTPSLPWFPLRFPRPDVGPGDCSCTPVLSQCLLLKRHQLPLSPHFTAEEVEAHSREL